MNHPTTHPTNHPTKHQPATILAWSLWTLWLLLTVVATWQAIADRGMADQFFVVALVGYATVGALVAAREPANAVGWLLLATGIVLALSSVGELYAIHPGNPGYVGVGWATALLFNVWLIVPVVFVPLLFPDGHLLSHRWRPVAWLGVATLTAGVLVSAFRPGELDLGASVQNPLGVDGVARTVIEVVDTLNGYALVAVVVLTGASLVARFRRSTGTERQQLKWFAYAGVVTAFGLSLAGVGELAPRSWGDPVGSVGWTIFLPTCVLGIPLAIGIAMLRHRLYDIDVVINRTLVYGTLTATLVITYVGTVLLLRLVLSPVTGESPLAIAASTLAVAALFRPARTRIQNLVDRRFYRRKYDAARTLDTFAAQLRHELDLDAVAHDLRTAVHDTVQPTHLSLWLREAPR